MKKRYVGFHNWQLMDKTPLGLWLNLVLPNVSSLIVEGHLQWSGGLTSQALASLYVIRQYIISSIGK